MPLPRLTLLLTAFSIFAIGIVMIFSTTSAEVLDQELAKSTHQAFIKQMLYAFAGLTLGSFLVFIGYRRLLALSGPLLWLFSLLLLLVLIPGIGREVNGSKRWLSIAGLSFQPSEFVKYVVPAFFIYRYLLFCEGKFYFKDFLKLIALVSIPMFLIMIEPNNGTTAVIAMTLFALFLIARIPAKYWAWPLVAFAALAGTFAVNLPYVKARLNVYLDPTRDLMGKGHQPYQAKIAAGSGQLFGKGPGNGLQKLSYLPEAQNDYIAAIYAEEFGFLGIALLIALYLGMASSAFYIACGCDDLGGFYLASAAIFLITFQAFMNLGVVSGLLPSTGLNLPLFSQGGTSLMANILGIAIIYSVASAPKQEEKPIYG